MPLSDIRILLLATALVIAGCSSSSSTPSASDDANSVDNANDGSDGDTTTVPDNALVESPLLNSDNANDVILQAFDVLSGRAYDQRMMSFPYVEPVDEGVGFTRRYLSKECQNLGAATQAQVNESGRFTNDTFFSDCLIGADVLNGRVEFVEESGCCAYQRTFSNDFSVNFEPGGVMELVGIYAYEPSLSSERTFGVSGFDYHFSYAGGTLSILNADTLRTIMLDGRALEDEPLASITGSFTMLAPVLDGASVNVTVTDDFVNTKIPYQLSYEQGRMEINASNSTIILNASNGDPSTVDVTITDANSSVTTTQNWSVWYAALSFVPSALGESGLKPVANGDGTLLSENNYTEVLTEVFAVYTGERFGPDILDLPDYPAPEFPFGFLTSGAADGLGDPEFQECVNGGNATLTPYKFGARQITSGWNFEFNNCEYNGRLFDGLFETRDFGNFIYQSEGLSIDRGNGSTQFSGLLDYKLRSNRDGGPPRHYALRGVNFVSDGPAGRNELSAATFLNSYILGFSASMTGSFSLANNVTQRATFNVMIDGALLSAKGFPGSSTGRLFKDFLSGVLVIDAGNGNTLWLNAATDDPLTFAITINRPGLEPIKLIENWEDWRERIAFKFDLTQ